MFAQLLFPLDPSTSTPSSSGGAKGANHRHKTASQLAGGLSQQQMIADSEAVIAWQAYALMLDALLPRLEEVAIKLSSSSSSSSSPSSSSLTAQTEKQQQDGCVDTINTCLQTIVSGKSYPTDQYILILEPQSDVMLISLLPNRNITLT